MLESKLILTKVGILLYASLLVVSEPNLGTTMTSFPYTANPAIDITTAAADEDTSINSANNETAILEPTTTKGQTETPTLPRTSRVNTSIETMTATTTDSFPVKTSKEMTSTTTDSFPGFTTKEMRNATLLTTMTTKGPHGFIDWLKTDIADGITGLSLILIVLAFFLGCLVVIGIVCCVRIYRSRKLRMEARKRINEVEKRPKKDVEDGIDSSVEDLTGSKQTPLVQDASIEITEDDQLSSDDQENMTKGDPQYAMVQRKENDKKKEKSSKLNQKQGNETTDKNKKEDVASGDDDKKNCNDIQKDKEGALTKDNDLKQGQDNGSPSIEDNNGYASVSINVVCPTETNEDDTHIMTSFKGKPAKNEQDEHEKGEEKVESESNKDKNIENSTSEGKIGEDNGAREDEGEDASQKRFETKL